MQNELFVFPTARGIRDYISSLEICDTFLPPTITIGDFFKNSSTTPNKAFIDNEKRFLLLKETAENIDLDKLAISKKFTAFLKQSDYIFRFFDELSGEMVDIEDLKMVDIYDEYVEHLTILQNLQREFIKNLEALDLVDKINLYKHYEVNHNFISKYDSITIFISGYLTKFELSVIKQISKYKNTNLVFEINRYNEDYLKKVNFENLIVELDTQVIYNVTNSVVLSTNKISTKNIIEPVIKGFSSRTNQIAFIKESIYKMTQSGILPENIVIVLPDETFAKYLELFDSERYFNFAMGRGISETIFYKKLNAIISYLADSDHKSKEKLKYYEIDRELLDKNIRSNYNKQITRHTLDLFIEFLDMSDLDTEIKEKIDEILYKLNILFFSLDEELMLSSGIKLIQESIANITQDDVGGGKVTVMGLLETRGVRYGDMKGFEGVIIVDFNDDKAPKSSIKDKFLSSHIKELASMPTLTNRQNLQKYYYKTLIDNAKEVYVSYVKDEQNSISRFAKEIFKTFDQNTYDDVYKSILYGSNKLQFSDKEYILDIDLSKYSFSATSLKDFLECKRRYFYKHIQKIKEHNISLMPQGYEIGTLVHSVLQNLYSNHKEIRSEDEFKSFVDYEINIIKNQVNNPMLSLELEIYKQKLYLLSTQEVKRYYDGYRIFDIEKSFLIKHNGISLNGKIDRIDEKEGKFYIIDYKTSQNLKVDTLKTYQTSCDFQLEFYYLGCGQNNIADVAYYDINKGKLIKEEMLEEKLELLDTILQSLHTTSVNFEKTVQKSYCSYCPYKIACGIGG
ncbi:MAG: PD-(D/E)XK nuclease family protein [Arcobacteraceae bacterium]|nr:PD-(D/E)XK nuclease family protein [Arcobacteraceae bacterium]